MHCRGIENAGRQNAGHANAVLLYRTSSAYPVGLYVLSIMYLITLFFSIYFKISFIKLNNNYYNSGRPY